MLPVINNKVPCGKKFVRILFRSYQYKAIDYKANYTLYHTKKIAQSKFKAPEDDK